MKFEQTFEHMRRTICRTEKALQLSAHLYEQSYNKFKICPAAMPHWTTIAEEAMVGAGLLVAGLALLPEELAAATLAAVAEGAIYLGAAETAAIIDGIGLAGAAAQYGGAAVGALETVQTTGAVMVGLGLGIGAVAAGGAIHNGLAGAPGNQTPTPSPIQQTPQQPTPALRDVAVGHALVHVLLVSAGDRCNAIVE